jgi:thiol:disulfide interchange protein DsbD
VTPLHPTPKNRRILKALLIWLTLCFLPLAGLAAEDPTTVNIQPQQEKGILDKLSVFGQRLGIGSNQGKFLPPGQAFVLTADVVDPYTLRVHWDIADGYYLYRSKFHFTPLDTKDITIKPVELPHGKEKHDDNFGLMEIFYHQFETELPLQRSNTQAQDLKLRINYQGCADAGFCYPPMKQVITLSLPEASGPPPQRSASTNTAANDNVVSDQDRYARSLAENSLLLSMLTFFGLGLLLTFTPCVFPMIPILSSIIAGQGSDITTRRAFTLSLTYVLAMAVTYTVAGLIAGLFGGNLQATFQNPWVLGSFSLVFVLLALSMFGFYELQMPQGIQSKLTEMSNRQRGGTFVGVGIMGFLSALIVGPCLAAPLAGALIYIGQTGDALLGAAALFALSMGMGAPLLLIGTSAGKLLPRAGGWMNTVKAVFGVLLLGVAIWLVQRIIPAAVGLLLWGILLVICAVYLGAFERLQPEASGWHKLWKGVGIVSLIYGGVLLVGAASGAQDMFRPLAKLSLASGNEASTPQEGLAFKRVKGLDGLQRELKLAAAQNKPVMLDFYADWCVSCLELARETFSDPDVQATLSKTKAVLLQADVTLNDEQDKALLKSFGLFGPPSILFFDTRGQELSRYRLVGFLDADTFEKHARAAFKL